MSGVSCVYQSYSSLARVSALSLVPRARCRSASYGSASTRSSQRRYSYLVRMKILLLRNKKDVRNSHTFSVQCPRNMMQLRIPIRIFPHSSAPPNHFRHILLLRRLTRRKRSQQRQQLSLRPCIDLLLPFVKHPNKLYP